MPATSLRPLHRTGGGHGDRPHLDGFQGVAVFSLENDNTDIWKEEWATWPTGQELL